MTAVLRELIRNGLLSTAHDVFEGGLATALAECCMQAEVGLLAVLPGAGDLAGRLFGEDHGRVVIAWSPEHTERVLRACAGVSLHQIGQTGGVVLHISDAIALDVSRMAGEYLSALTRFAEGTHAIS